MPKRALLLVLPALIALLIASAYASAERSVQRPSDFTARVDNPWFPLTPGTTYIYRGSDEGRPSRDVVTVTHRTRKVDGVPCVSSMTACSERPAGRAHDGLVFAGQAGQRLVLRRDDRDFRPNGHVTSTDGSWEAGRDGARAGIFMPARPRVGQSFRQEFYRGHAEDHFQIVEPASEHPGALHLVETRAADQGVDAARTRSNRPQALRA